MSGVILWEIGFEHALEGVQLGEHGEEKGVYVTGNGTAVLGTNHLDTRVVGNYNPRRRLLLNIDELDGAFQVSSDEFGPQDVSDMLLCNVHNV